jgi:hypothetical protein
MTLEVRLVVGGDAEGAKRAAQESERALDSMANAAGRASEQARRLATANDNVTNAAGRQRQAIAALTAAEARMTSGISDSRAADIAAYGQELDRLRAKFNPLFAASKQYEAELGEINRATRLGAITTDEQAAAIGRLNARYQGQAVAASQAGAAMVGSSAAAGAAVKLNAFQVQNLSFQMNDMATMLASGQSPFTMMMQQGMQVAQIFGPGVGVGAALKATGSALTSFLLNPLTLAVLGFAAASGAASLFFRAVSSGGDEAGDALERHEELIGRIKEAYGDAAAGARAYAAESRAVLAFEAERSLAELELRLKTGVQGIINDLRFTDIFGGEQVVEGFESFSGAIDELARSAEAGAPDLQGFRDAVVALAQQRPELRATAIELLNLSEELYGVERAARAAQSIAAGTPNARIMDAFDVAGRARGDGAQTALEERVRQRERAQRDAEQARRRAVSETERQRQAVQGLIASQQMELDLLRETDPVQQEMIRLRETLAHATDEERAAVQGLIATRVRETEVAQAAEGAQRALGNVMGDVFSAATRDADSFVESLQRIVQGLIEAEVRARLLGNVGPIGQILGSVFGGAGGAGAALPAAAPGGMGPAQFGLGQLFHSGEIVGAANRPTRLVPVDLWANAPRAHGGAFLRPREVPIIAEEGEGVASRNQMSRLIDAATRPPQIVNQIQVVNQSGTPLAGTVRDVPDGRGGRRAEVVLEEMVVASAGRPRTRRALGLPPEMRRR